MESGTGFELEKEIKVWKSLLFADQSLSNDNISELENHLEDEMHGLQKIGLSTEESFLVAKKRVGDVEVITSEFEKVNRHLSFKNRALPYIKGVLLFMGFFTVTELMSNSVMLLSDAIGMSDIYISWSLTGLFVLLTIATIAFVRKKVHSRTFGAKLLSSIPILAGIVVVSKLLTFLSFPLLTRSMEVSTYGMMQANLSMYKLMFAVAVLIASIVWFSGEEVRGKLRATA